MKRLYLDLGEFREFIKLKKLICYGCGSAGIRAIDIMENWGKSSDIILFVDSDKNKWDKTIGNDKSSYPIVSINEALKQVDKNTIILITCTTDILEIREMLDQYVELDNIECFSLVEIAQQQLLKSDYKEIICESNSIIIPKKIHYCWFGGKKPILIEQVIDSWKQICSDYEIIEWNETNYDVSKNQYMKQAYESKAWGFVPDYARLDIIYNEGGIYLDTDVRILKKPDKLLYQKNFFISDCSFEVNLGSGFGAQPKEQIIKEFMDYYDGILFKLKDGTFNKVICVVHQYNVLKKYGMKINDQFQRVHGANIYPMILGGTNAHTMQLRNNEKAIFAHYGVTSWKDKKTIESRKRIRDYFQIEGLENYDI